MKQFTPMFLLILTSLLFWQCSKNTSDPPPPAGPDTTSHNFVWQIDTLGTFGSVLFDVAIVNENDIWAVGEIHTAETDTVDSLGNWVPPYNAVHWNGSGWEFQRILVNFRGQPTWVALQGVFALKDGNVLFSSGLPYLPEANGWKLYHLWDIGVLDDEDGSVYQIWGTSLSNLYFAGSKGTIVHYDGSSWQKLDSGTEVTLVDVYGSSDGSVVWACGFTPDNRSTVLLKITGATVEIVYEDSLHRLDTRPDTLSGLLTGVWTDSPERLFVMSNAGMYIADARTTGAARRVWLNDSRAPGFPRAFFARHPNDIFTGGDFGFLAHYNGSTWRHYTELSGLMRIRGISTAENFAVAVGIDLSAPVSRAILITGNRF